MTTTSHKKINILECIRQGQIGGGESHLLSLVENLNKDLFHPVVLSFTDGPMIERLEKMGIKAYVIPTENPFDIRVWKKVKALLVKEKIDVVHAHGTRANSNVLWPAKALKLPVIYSIHGWSFHDDQQFLVKKARVLSEKILTNKSNVNISVSASSQQSGKKYIPSFESVVVNNGIDQQKFDPARQFTDVRKELGIDPAATLLLFIARFTAHKQPLSLLKAFAIALKTLPDMVLLMVGDGDQKEEALKLVKEAGIGDKVIFEKFRSDVPDVLAAADIFILPSLWEGLPIGLLEAMSMGKAVIATNVDGTSEVVTHAQNGHLVQVAELKTALPEALVLLATNTEMRKKYSRKAIETVNDRFNAAGMTKQIENIYLEQYKPSKN